MRTSTEMFAPASYRRLLLVVIAVSVILRVASALYHGPTIEPLPGVTDQISYHQLAIRVMDGHGFSFATGWWPATKANEPTAHWSFLYVLFLAGIYSLVGPVPLIARIVQAVIVGVLHPLLMWRIGNRLFGTTVGLATAAFTSVYLYFVYYSGALLTESIYIVVFLWVIDLATAIAYAMATSRGSSIRPWLLFGMALAAGALLRQVFLLVVPFILAWIVWQWFCARASRNETATGLSFSALAARLTLAMVILAACVLPWTYRNYKAFGEMVLLNTNAGFVFFWGNHPIHGDQFIPILPNDPQVNYMTLLPRELMSQNEAQIDKALLLRGLGFVRDDPARYVRLSISRIKEYFKFWPTADSGLASNVVRTLSFGLMLPFLVGGILLGVTRRGPHDSGAERWLNPGAVLLLVVAAVYSGVHLLTWTLVRYRLPVDAIAMPFAGLGVVYLAQRVGGLAISSSNVSLNSSPN